MTSTKTGGAKAPPVGRSKTTTNGQGKTVTFRGLTLVLPKECPGEVLFAVEGDNISDVLRTLVGEDQYLKVREKVAKDKLTLTQTRDQLLNLVTGIFNDTYGITSGE